jgi:hypothetical protein
MQLLAHCGVKGGFLLNTICCPPCASVRVLKLTANELVLKNEEPVYKLGLSYTPYERRVLSLEFPNAGLLYVVLFGKGTFGLLFGCGEWAFH